MNLRLPERGGAPQPPVSGSEVRGHPVRARTSWTLAVLSGQGRGFSVVWLLGSSYQPDSRPELSGWVQTPTFRLALKLKLACSERVLQTRLKVFS